MIPGFPTTCPPGSHEHFFELREPADLGDGIGLEAKARSGYEQYARLAVDGVLGNPAVRVPASGFRKLLGPYEHDDDEHAVTVLPQGDWAALPDLDLLHGQWYWESARTDRIFLELQAQPSFWAYGTDAAQLANWSLSGLKRFRNCAPVHGRPTWGRLALTLEDNGGDYTLTLLLDGIAVAQGTRTGNGTLDLAEANGSGISGSVDLTFSAEITTAHYVVADWPARYAIHFQASSGFGGGDFPRTAEGTIYDDGAGQTFRFRSDKQGAGGTLYVLPHQVNANGIESAGTGGEAVTLNLPPEPVTALAYDAGGSTDTDISWTASATALATYNVYDSGETGELDVESVTASEPAGSGTIVHALPALSAGFTGRRFILVRAVSTGGIEEGSFQLLVIEYAAGTRVAPRPNIPIPSPNPLTAGRQLTVTYTLGTAGQAIAAATVELDVFAWGSAPTWASPGSAAVPAAVGGIAKGTVSKTAGADGVFGFAIRAKSAAGTPDGNAYVYGPVYLASAAPADPAGYTARAGS